MIKQRSFGNGKFTFSAVFIRKNRILVPFGPHGTVISPDPDRPELFSEDIIFSVYNRIFSAEVNGKEICFDCFTFDFFRRIFAGSDFEFLSANSRKIRIKIVVSINFF